MNVEHLNNRLWQANESLRTTESIWGYPERSRRGHRFQGELAWNLNADDKLGRWKARIFIEICYVVQLVTPFIEPSTKDVAEWEILERPRSIMERDKQINKSSSVRHASRVWKRNFGLGFFCYLSCISLTRHSLIFIVDLWLYHHRPRTGIGRTRTSRDGVLSSLSRSFPPSLLLETRKARSLVSQVLLTLMEIWSSARESQSTWHGFFAVVLFFSSRDLSFFVFCLLWSW